MTPSPKHIRAVSADAVLELEWPDASIDRLSFHSLRCACPCAVCVDEVTGVRVLDVKTIPEDIHPDSIEFCGNYALKIRWSDAHDTGLYTWTHFRRLAARETA